MTASTTIEMSKSQAYAAAGPVNTLSYFFLKKRRFIPFYRPVTRPGLSTA
jgi:hypothetical protein